MPVYYEAINGTIYVCNRNHNVKTPLGAVNNSKLSSEQLKEVADSLNAAYQAGYRTSLNQVKALLDNIEVQHRAEVEKSTN